MNTRIFIDVYDTNSVLVRSGELEVETSFNFVDQTASPFIDISSRKVGVTSTIQVPLTPSNQRLLGYVSVGTRDVTYSGVDGETMRGSVYKGNTVLSRNMNVFITKVLPDRVELYMVDPAANVLTDLAELSVEDIDFSSFFVSRTITVETFLTYSNRDAKTGAIATFHAGKSVGDPSAAVVPGTDPSSDLCMANTLYTVYGYYLMKFMIEQSGYELNGDNWLDAVVAAQPGTSSLLYTGFIPEQIWEVQPDIATQSVIGADDTAQSAVDFISIFSATDGNSRANAISEDSAGQFYVHRLVPGPTQGEFTWVKEIMPGEVNNDKPVMGVDTGLFRMPGSGSTRYPSFVIFYGPASSPGFQASMKWDVNGSIQTTGTSFTPGIYFLWEAIGTLPTGSDMFILVLGLADTFDAFVLVTYRASDAGLNLVFPPGGGFGIELSDYSNAVNAASDFYLNGIGCFTYFSNVNFTSMLAIVQLNPNGASSYFNVIEYVDVWPDRIDRVKTYESSGTRWGVTFIGVSDTESGKIFTSDGYFTTNWTVLFDLTQFATGYEALAVSNTNIFITPVSANSHVYYIPISGDVTDLVLLKDLSIDYPGAVVRDLRINSDGTCTVRGDYSSGSFVATLLPETIVGTLAVPAFSGFTAADLLQYYIQSSGAGIKVSGNVIELVPGLFYEDTTKTTHDISKHTISYFDETDLNSLNAQQNWLRYTYEDTDEHINGSDDYISVFNPVLEESADVYTAPFNYTPGKQGTPVTDRYDAYTNPTGISGEYKMTSVIAPSADGDIYLDFSLGVYATGRFFKAGFDSSDYSTLIPVYYPVLESYLSHGTSRFIELRINLDTLRILPGDLVWSETVGSQIHIVLGVSYKRDTLLLEVIPKRN